MERPRIRHIAINVKDRDAEAEYYKKHFGLEEQDRGPNGTIYLSDGFIGVALISIDDRPYGINHFGFQVESIEEIEKGTGTATVANIPGAVGESFLADPEGNRVDISEGGWPI
jgi:catechol 2,3-dioxygenase-like lactoylglutathione lyase family enzyme